MDNMDGFWASAARWWEEKTTSPLYFTYICFFITWNWRLFQLIFLEDSQKFTGPRIQYISKALEYNSMKPEFWYRFTDIVINIGWRIIPPAILTYLAIKYLPLVHVWAHRIHLENSFQRQEAYDLRNLEYERQKTSLLTKKAEQKVKQSIETKKIDKVQTQEEKWKEEFDQIKRQDLLHAFQRLVAVLYKHGGVLYGTQVENYLPNSSAIMAFAGTHDLISTEKRESGSPIVQLTDKGKYFSRLLADKGIAAQ